MKLSNNHLLITYSLSPGYKDLRMILESFGKKHSKVWSSCNQRLWRLPEKPRRMRTRVRRGRSRSATLPIRSRGTVDVSNRGSNSSRIKDIRPTITTKEINSFRLRTRTVKCTPTSKPVSVRTVDSSETVISGTYLQVGCSFSCCVSSCCSNCRCCFSLGRSFVETNNMRKKN